MPKPKKELLDDRLGQFVKEFQVPEERRKEAISALRLIIEKTFNPSSFCPTCDDKLVFDGENGVLKCLNCGYKFSIQTYTQGLTPSQTSPNTPRNVGTQKGNTIPPQVEEAIRRTTETTALGEKIRKLANSEGSVPPTPEDKSLVESTTGLKGVNFV